MTFCLRHIAIKPKDGISVKSAIILLHGYGGDGNDISVLAIYWKRYLPNTVFICPNGHEKNLINPNGYQWFDLTQDDPEYILEQSKKAEQKLNQFIAEIKKEYNLENNKICLSGFSQGCMMSINLGLTSEKEYACVVGFSGKIINKEDLQKRIKCSTNILLIHGDMDQIVPPSFLLESKDFLIRNEINIETKLIKNCYHHISIEASSTALNYIIKKI